VLFSDSRVAAKMTVGCTVNTVVEPPVKKVAETPVKKKTEPPKQGLFRKGFLNLPQIVSIPPASPREVNTVALVGPSSPPSGCINGFSQSRNWPVGFDHDWEIVVWEEEDDYWDGLPLDWALDGDFGEEAMAIRDDMELEYQRDKMIARQKSKGKRELLNLHSSINYGDTIDPSRRRKC
jgi:hypothetical protein